jgi:hypothetical protein
MQLQKKVPPKIPRSLSFIPIVAQALGEENVTALRFPFFGRLRYG